MVTNMLRNWTRILLRNMPTSKENISTSLPSSTSSQQLSQIRTSTHKFVMPYLPVTRPSRGTVLPQSLLHPSPRQTNPSSHTRSLLNDSLIGHDDNVERVNGMFVLFSHMREHILSNNLIIIPTCRKKHDVEWEFGLLVGDGLLFTSLSLAGPCKRQWSFFARPCQQYVRCRRQTVTPSVVISWWNWNFLVFESILFLSTKPFHTQSLYSFLPSFPDDFLSSTHLLYGRNSNVRDDVSNLQWQGTYKDLPGQKENLQFSSPISVHNLVVATKYLSGRALRS